MIGYLCSYAHAAKRNWRVRTASVNNAWRHTDFWLEFMKVKPKEISHPTSLSRKILCITHRLLLNRRTTKPPTMRNWLPQWVSTRFSNHFPHKVVTLIVDHCGSSGGQVIVLIKAESENLNEQSTEDAVKEEEIGSKESETKPKSDPPNQETNETTSSKYKGRGRPRKGQEVKKEKRVPKPHALEMCQICGQLFRCIKTHMFVHDTNPQVTQFNKRFSFRLLNYFRFELQFECHHCGRKFKHKPNLICHVKNHQNVR